VSRNREYHTIWVLKNTWSAAIHELDGSVVGLPSMHIHAQIIATDIQSMSVLDAPPPQDGYLERKRIDKVGRAKGNSLMMFLVQFGFRVDQDNTNEEGEFVVTHALDHTVYEGAPVIFNTRGKVNRLSQALAVCAWLAWFGVRYELTVLVIMVQILEPWGVSYIHDKQDRRVKYFTATDDTSDAALTAINTIFKRDPATFRLSMEYFHPINASCKRIHTICIVINLSTPDFERTLRRSVVWGRSTSARLCSTDVRRDQPCTSVSMRGSQKCPGCCTWTFRDRSHP
jgi:hypothetical protein